MSSLKASKTKANHYHLLCGAVVYKRDKESNEVLELKMNVVIKSAINQVTPYRLGKAQVVLQQRLVQGMPEDQIEKLELLDVVFFGVSYLGYMTDAEYTYNPDEAPAAPVMNDPFQ